MAINNMRVQFALASALGLTALADRAEQTRLAGGDPSPDIDLGGVLLERTIETARRG